MLTAKLTAVPSRLRRRLKILSGRSRKGLTGLWGRRARAIRRALDPGPKERAKRTRAIWRLEPLQIVPDPAHAAALGIVAAGDAEVGEPGLVQHPRRGRVLDEGEGLERAQTAVAGVLDHREHALRGVAPAPVRPAERIAELVDHAGTAEPDAAERRAILPTDHQKGLARGRGMQLDPVAHRGLGHRV